MSVEIHNETGYSKRGVYRIYLFDGDAPVEIPRVRGVDKQGLLLIGRSENIENRRKRFIRSEEGRGPGHSEGQLLFLMKQFFEKLKEQQIRFNFDKVDSKKEAEEMEKEELRKYFKIHLELPPLNSAMPRRREWFDELRAIDKYACGERLRNHPSPSLRRVGQRSSS